MPERIMRLSVLCGQLEISFFSSFLLASSVFLTFLSIHPVSRRLQMLARAVSRRLGHVGRAICGILLLGASIEKIFPSLGTVEKRQNLMNKWLLAGMSGTTPLAADLQSLSRLVLHTGNVNQVRASLLCLFLLTFLRLSVLGLVGLDNTVVLLGSSAEASRGRQRRVGGGHSARRRTAQGRRARRLGHGHRAAAWRRRHGFQQGRREAHSQGLSQGFLR